ncbi:MAG: hypothetical protein RMJ07_05210 [Nitrososphaerota archaeon]|nr:hypothetical protein [Candidatus Bathyarchaeota archaeon]MDW8049062.1 hypothetical protein [Nitrososphaerota archaeon]
MSDEIEKYLNDPLWPILVETVHSMPMYRYHKAYVAEKMLNELPQLTPRKLAVKLGIPLGEALVILYEIKMGI